jgi:PAS domain S-box-containing protein
MKDHIDREIFKLTQSWGTLLLIVGALLIMALSLLDFFVTPENFSRFLIYRLITAALYVPLLLLHISNNKFESGKLQLFIFLTAPLIATVMVEAMVLSFGGHQSPYYAGMIIVSAFIIGFLPLSTIYAVSLTLLMLTVYVVPILLLDEIINYRIFVNNIFFLSAIGCVGLVWRGITRSLLLKKLSLEVDLSQDKEKLEKYSTQLEQLVEERTKELNKSETMLRSLFENANDGIMIMDSNGIILSVNEKACEIHGFEKNALIGVNIGLLETEENKPLFEERKRRILKGEALMFETQHYKKDGTRVSIEVSSKAVEVEGNLIMQSFHRDITEKKKLQGQLFQSQKMESIGVLAGGIAHDFNNILSAILGHAELLHEFSNLDATAKQRVKIIEGSSRKAGQMVSKLLSFARQGSFESAPLSLNSVIRDTIELLERMMAKKKITINMEVDPALPPVSGDSNQLEQVVMNLAVNAGDAMPSGGTLTIATTKEAFEKDEAARIHPLLLPGKYVVMKISDTGTGIPEEIRDRIFDPFFTTKGPGKGTGLGLAMVYGIVKEHRGVINLRSQLGKGTTFEIYLPVSDKFVPKAVKTSGYSVTGREKILVIDDEEDVLSFMKDVLETQGYKVMATTNPVYGLDTFKQINEEIDLVITDIVMPLVNGRELIKHFKLIKPSVKVIAISGYDIWGTEKRDKDINAYLRKPFEGIYLLSIVRRVLDSAPATFPRQGPFDL